MLNKRSDLLWLHTQLFHSPKLWSNVQSDHARFVTFVQSSGCFTYVHKHVCHVQVPTVSLVEKAGSMSATIALYILLPLIAHNLALVICLMPPNKWYNPGMGYFGSGVGLVLLTECACFVRMCFLLIVMNAPPYMTLPEFYLVRIEESSLCSLSQAHKHPLSAAVRALSLPRQAPFNDLHYCLAAGMLGQFVQSCCQLRHKPVYVLKHIPCRSWQKCRMALGLFSAFCVLLVTSLKLCLACSYSGATHLTCQA